MWWHLWKSTLVGEEKPAAGINASSSGKCQQIDFSGIAARIPTFLWCDHDSNLPLVRPGFQPSACATRIPTFLWCDQDSNLPLARPGFQPSSGATRIPTFLWCDQDSNLPLVRPGFQPSAGATRIPTFLWCDQDSNLPLVRLGFQPRCLGNPVASRLNAHSQIHWFLEDQAKKNLNSIARSCHEQLISYLDIAVNGLSHLALAIRIFVVVDFDKLAQAHDFHIERRQVASLCWDLDSNPGVCETNSTADWMPTHKPTDQAKTSCAHKWGQYTHALITTTSSRNIQQRFICCSRVLHSPHKDKCQVWNELSQ